MARWALKWRSSQPDLEAAAWRSGLIVLKKVMIYGTVLVALIGLATALAIAGVD